MPSAASETISKVQHFGWVTKRTHARICHIYSTRLPKKGLLVEATPRSQLKDAAAHGNSCSLKFFVLCFSRSHFHIRAPHRISSRLCARVVENGWCVWCVVYVFLARLWPNTCKSILVNLQVGLSGNTHTTECEK